VNNLKIPLFDIFKSTVILLWWMKIWTIFQNIFVFIYLGW